MFRAALTAQGDRSELGTLQTELVRDWFISCLKKVKLQDKLAFEKLAPKEILKRAQRFEESKQATRVHQEKKQLIVKKLQRAEQNKPESNLNVQNQGNRKSNSSYNNYRKTETAILLTGMKERNMP